MKILFYAICAYLIVINLITLITSLQVFTTHTRCSLSKYKKLKSTWLVLKTIENGCSWNSITIQVSRCRCVLSLSLYLSLSLSFSSSVSRFSQHRIVQLSQNYAFIFVSLERKEECEICNLHGNKFWSA